MGRRKSDLPGYDKLIESLKDFYATGASIQECAEKFKISTTTVLDWLKKSGTYVRSVKETIELKKQLGTYITRPRRISVSEEQVRELYCVQKWSCVRIAEYLKLDLSTLIVRMDEFGIERTRENSAEIRRATNREKYGGDSAFSDPTVDSQRRRTNLEKYGSENPFQSLEIQKKIRQTNLKRYGVENPGQSSELREKTKKTNLEKYGVEHPMQSEIFKQRVREFYQDPEVRARMQPIWDRNAAELKRVRDTLEYKEWYRNRMMELHGRPGPNMGHLSLESVEILGSRQGLKKYIEDNKLKTTMQVYQGLGCSESLITTRLHQYDLWDCIDHYTSQYEIEIGEILTGLGFEFEKTRSILPGRYEIDFFIQELNLGIEFNGDYYHSEALKDEKYHQKKSLLGEEEGVFIYHIFEYEWLDPVLRPKIMSQLMDRLKLNTEVIGARKCVVQEIEAAESNHFLNRYHLQGEDRSSVRVGLFYRDELVSLMTFGRPRWTDAKEYDQEIYRFVTRSGLSVPGGASRLFKYFTKNYSPRSVFTYSDFSKSSGEVYRRLGFEYLGLSSPSYVWNNMMGIVRSRYSTQMSNEKSEMSKQGFVRICNSGNKRWGWRAE